MKKLSFLLVLVCIAALVFAGGGRDRSGGAAETITLRVLYYLDASAANAVPDANLWFSTFEQNNPGVRIERENLFDEPFHDKLRAYSSAGDLPDVMYVWPTTRSEYLWNTTHQLKDLMPFIERDNLRGYYMPFVLDPANHASGRLDILPQGVTATHAFYVNMEVLEAAGLQPARTYAELVAQVPVLRARGIQTVLIPAQSNWVMQSCFFSMILGRFAGADWDKRIANNTASFTDPDFVAGFDFIRQIFADGVIQRDSFGVDYGDGPGMFANNRAAYYIDGDWRLGAFITDEQTGQALITPERQNNIRVTVFPEIPGAKFNASSSVILGVGYAMSADIPAGSAKERAAWELVKYMVGKDVSQLRTQRGGTPTPSRTDLDFAAMNLEPMQIAVGNLGTQYTTGTAVIDGVLAGEVNGAIEVGLIELAMGRRTAAQVAADVQRVHERQ